MVIFVEAILRPVEAILYFVEAKLSYVEAIFNPLKIKSTHRFHLDLEFDNYVLYIGLYSFKQGSNKNHKE